MRKGPTRRAMTFLIPALLLGALQRQALASGIDFDGGAAAKTPVREILGAQTKPSVPESAPAKIAVKDASSAAPADSAPVIVSGTIEKTGTAPDISADAQEVLSVYTTKKGVIHRQTFVTYVLKVDPASLPKFKEAGFAPLQDIQIQLVWRRISDINGWGVDVNGQCYRAWTATYAFSGSELEQGFALMRDFLTDPLAVLHRDPKGENYVRVANIGAERGYVVDSSIDIRTGHVWTENETELFANGSRSGYYNP